jgi:hypothetical protein
MSNTIIENNQVLAGRLAPLVEKKRLKSAPCHTFAVRKNNHV